MRGRRMTREEAKEFIAQSVKSNVDMALVADAIKALEQKPRKGHWILKRTFPTKLYDEYLNEYKCSECYREIRCTESQLVNYPYCHCGVRMIESQGGEDA